MAFFGLFQANKDGKIVPDSDETILRCRRCGDICPEDRDSPYCLDCEDTEQRKCETCGEAMTVKEHTKEFYIGILFCSSECEEQYVDSENEKPIKKGWFW